MLERFIHGLGIPGIGAHLSSVLAERFGNIVSLMEADEGKLDTPGIDTEKTRSIIKFFYEPGNKMSLNGFLRRALFRDKLSQSKRPS